MVNLIPAFHSKSVFISAIRWVSCKQQIVRSSFLIQFAKRYLLMGELSLLTVSVNIYRYVVSCFCCLRVCVQSNQCCSLIACLVSYCLMLPILSWFCVLSSSVCRIPHRIFCSGGLLVIYCFSFCLL
jgi:hypothetical protein